MKDRRGRFWAAVLVLATTIASVAVHAHSGGSLAHPLDWHTDQIEQVVTSGAAGRKISVEGKDCLAGAYRIGMD